MEIEVEEKDQVVVFHRAWDCGSSLYDSFELASVYRILDNHLMAVPGNGVSERAPARRTAPAKSKVKAKGWRRRKAAAALAARREGKAVLRSIFRSVTSSRRL